MSLKPAVVIQGMFLTPQSLDLHLQNKGEVGRNRLRTSTSTTQQTGFLIYTTCFQSESLSAKEVGYVTDCLEGTCGHWHSLQEPRCCNQQYTWLFLSNSLKKPHQLELQIRPRHCHLILHTELSARFSRHSPAPMLVTHFKTHIS